MTKKIFFFAVLAFLFMGCASTPQASTEITVEATDFAYTPGTITVPVSEPVELTLNNTGNVEHDFIVDNINVTDVSASETGPAAHHQGGHEAEADYDLHFFARAGETETLQFTALEPGTYRIFCSVEGHEEAGMIGELVVEAQE
jgi:uncharacterized cupredoxin-like copper-binding protein